MHSDDRQNKNPQANHQQPFNQKPPSKQKDNTSMAKRRKTAIALGAISTIILTSVAFEVVSGDFWHKEEKTITQTSARSPELKILSDLDDDIIAYNDFHVEMGDDEISVIQFLTRQKNLQTKKIQELKNQLFETQARLQQLKTDILIHGGQKEQTYQEKIIKLDEQLAHANTTFNTLKAEISARDHVIEGKRDQLENLSKIFTETNAKLQKQLEQNDSNFNAELEQEIAQSNNHILELEKLVDEVNGKSIQSATKAKNLAIALHEKQSELEESQEQIMSLIALMEQTERSSTGIRDQLAIAMADTNDRTNITNDIASLRSRLINEEKRANDLEQKLNIALGNYKTEQQKATELEQKLAQLKETEVPEKGSSRTNMSQYRLIKDLEKNLAQLERKNKELEMALQKTRSDKSTALPTQERHNAPNKNLQDELSSIDETFYKERINDLEKTIENHKQSNAIGLDEKEKIHTERTQKIIDQNKVLSNQLQETEEDLQMAQKQLQVHQKHKSDLEQEIAISRRDTELLNKQLQSITQEFRDTGSLKDGTQKLNATLDHVTQSLQREKAKKRELEAELAKLREQVLDHENEKIMTYKDAPLQKNINDIQVKYEKERNKVAELERQLEANTNWAKNLQNELSAYEGTAGSTKETPNTADPNKLKAKIAYLTTRLAQESQKHQTTEEQLGEMNLTLREMKERNQQLETAMRQNPSSTSRRDERM